MGWQDDNCLYLDVAADSTLNVKLGLQKLGAPTPNEVRGSTSQEP